MEYTFHKGSHTNVTGKCFSFFSGSFSLPIFYVLRKSEENLWSESLNFLENAPSNSIHLTSSVSSAAVLNASLMVKVCESDGNI